MKKDLLIIGSTGSIGDSTLRVVNQHRDKFRVKTLIASSSVEKIAKQAVEFDVENVGLNDNSKYRELKSILSNYPQINVIAGEEALDDLFSMQYDVTVAAATGFACLKPIIKVIPNTKVLGLANKESIVCAGSILTGLAERYDTVVIPIDSEHSAIFQALDQSNHKAVNRLILTASGGPFLNTPVDQFKFITPEMAIAHPIWKMGAKISVDSATMMNKGLEIIEAHYLFGIDGRRIDAVIHPQALVHGFVEYSDGSIIAQISDPDMQTPISIALGYPKRLDIKYKLPTWERLSTMSFNSPDEKFRCLKLAKEALYSGQSKCIELNSANEVAVAAFLNKKISFDQIPDVIERTLSVNPEKSIKDISEIFEIAETASIKASGFVQNLI